MNKMGYFKGISFMFIWYIGIIWSVIYVYTPFMLLLLISRKTFRKVTDIILSCWEMYPASLLEVMMGTRVFISGDDILPSDSSIIIMNHRNRLDWFFLWAALLHSSKPPAHRCKFVLKSDVRHLPGIGWGLQMAGFLFIDRNWETDQLILQESLDYFRDIGQKYQILIFPEGTNFCSDTKTKSDAFAKKSGLPSYNYVLHPRTTGFAFLVKHMQQNGNLDSVYDLTVGYPKTLPRNEIDILRGRIPEEVHFHIKRHPVSSLPTTDREIVSWCESRWSDKEKMLDSFYSEEDTDKRRFSPEVRVDGPWNALYLALWAWSGVTILTLYLTFYTTWGFYWTIFSILAFVLESYFTKGIQLWEIALFRRFDMEKFKKTN